MAKRASRELTRDELELRKLLQGEGITVRGAARKLEVSARTVYRRLIALQELGLDIVSHYVRLRRLYREIR